MPEFFNESFEDTANERNSDLVLEAARRQSRELFASFDRHHSTAPAVAEEALAKKKALDAAIEWFEHDSVGAECSRLESDQLEIHDALVAAGLEGAINAQSIIERIKQLANGRLLLVTGTPADGLTFHGPYLDGDDVDADHPDLRNNYWWLVELRPPLSKEGT